MAAGVELAVGYITLAAETKTLSRDMARAFTGVESQAVKSGQAMGRTVEGAAASAGESAGRGMGAKLGGALAAATTTVAGVALTGLGVALTKGFGRLQAIEQAQAKLTGLGHTADSVAQIMKNSTAAVKGTAFGLDQAATVAAGAVASGIKPGEQLERTLKLVADSASIANVPMSEMGAIFNKVSSSGKLQGDVLAQLGDKGIPIVQLLGESLGKTSEEIYDMSKKGQIDFAIFQDAMEKGMGGAALESGKTLQGAMANTKASLGRIGANLLSGVYPQFTKFFQGLITFMDPLEGKAKVLGATIGVAMERGTAGVGGLYDVLVKGDFSTRFREAFKVEEDSKLVDFLFSVREGFQSLHGFLTGAGAILFSGTFVGAGIMGLEEDSTVVGFLFSLREGFMGIGQALGLLNFSSWEAFKASAAEAGGTVGGAFSSMGDSLNTLGPAFAEFGRQLPDITGAFVKLGGVSLNALAFGLGFLADNVDTIIAWMPVIVAGFIAWGVASTALAVSQFKLQMAQAAAAPALLLSNILRFASVRAETALSIAQTRSTATTNASTAATVRSRVATAASTAATWASVAAQKASNLAKIAGAAAAKGLGIALKVMLGPIGWIITGITLLVAGLVWFFTQTELGKGIVQKAFAAIKTAIAAVVDWWNNTLIPALQTVGQWFKDVWEAAGKAVEVSAQWIMDAAGNIASFFDQYVAQPVKLALEVMGAAFTWVYESIIKPVFGAIFTVANGFYLGFRGILQLVVAIFKEIIAPAFMDFWQGIIAPVFAAVGGIFTAWWEATKIIFDAVVGFVRDTLGAIFTWFRDFIITPVFDFIVGYVTWWWSTISGTFNTVVGFIQTVLGAAFTWFRDVIIKPVFDFIVGYVTWWWNTISGIFNTVIGFLRNVLGTAFTWLKDTIITPVFNGIRDVISNVWNNGIKPVFDFLSNAIEKDVPSAFEKGKEAVKKIWDQIQEIAKKPVRFVIQDVINNGLIGSFNKVAGILPGIKTLDPVALPPGFRDGGYTGKLARDQIAGVVHGDEHVIRSESRRSIEGAAPGLLERFNQLGAKALEVFGYRKGGRVNPVKNMTLTQGYSAFHDGIDIGVGVGTPVFATGDGVVTHAGQGASAPGVSGGLEVHIKGDGIERWFAHLSQIGVKVGQQVSAGQQIALSGNTGISSGPHLHFGAYAGGWPNAMNPLSYLAGASAPEGGDSGPGWFDPFGPLTSLADGVMQKVKDAIPGGGFMVDAAAGIGKKLINDVIGWGKGKLGMGGVTGAPTLFDGGGWLTNTGSPQLIDHQRSKPDAVLTNQQWRDVHSLVEDDSRRAGDITNNFYELSSPRATALQTTRLQRGLG